MKNIILLLPLFLCSALLRAQPPAPPTIVHEGPATVVAGQPLRIVARVSSTDPLKEVKIHVAQSGGAAPVELPLRSAGAGVYSLQLNPQQFSGVDEFRYYLDAKTEPGAFTETNWMTVKVIGGGTEALAGTQKSSWQKPTLIVGGAAVAIGAGVALAGGSGGGGDGDGEGVDPADNVLVRTASDQVDESGVILPRARVVEAGDLSGRTIRRVRIQLQFDAVDGGEEDYEIIYNGATVLSGRTGGNISEQVDVLGSDDTQVLIQVTDSVAVDGNQAFRWDATVTFFLE